MNALLVKDEALRIEALNQYEVLNSAPDPVLDDLDRLAAQICDTPVARISFIGSDRIWMVAFRHGIARLSARQRCPARPPSSATPSTRFRTRATTPTIAPDGILLEGRPIASTPVLR